MEGKSLERILARSGDPVLRWQGRLLASSVDPRREAKDWVNQHRHRLGGADRAVIIGMGCGYHLAEAASEWPRLKMIAVGFEANLVEPIREIHGLALGGCEFLVLGNETQVFESTRLRNYLKAAAPVVPHLPSQFGAPAAYAELKARLLMREPLFFSDWIRHEPRLAQLFPLRSIPGGDSRPLLSIKDLDRLLSPQDGAQSRDIQLLKALRELVR